MGELKDATVGEEEKKALAPREGAKMTRGTKEEDHQPAPNLKKDENI